MSEAQRRRYRRDGISDETRAKISAARTGIKLSAETKARIAAAQRERLRRQPMSEETKAKISASKKGHKHSAETRAKMSESHKRKGTK